LALATRNALRQGDGMHEDQDGTLYCSRQDKVVGVERCYACEYGVVVHGQVACAYDDIVPKLRLSEALRWSLRRLRPSAV
jgi:hypothetical protein